MISGVGNSHNISMVTEGVQGTAENGCCLSQTAGCREGDLGSGEPSEEPRLVQEKSWQRDVCI